MEGWPGLPCELPQKMELTTTTGSVLVRAMIAPPVLVATLFTKVQFEIRAAALEGGLCTQDDSKGETLVASGGQFVTNAVERGHTAFNATTADMAVVLEVISETELRTQPLTGGSGGTWTNGDGYAIYPNIRCTLSGGNIVNMLTFVSSPIANSSKITSMLEGTLKISEYNSV